MNTNINEIASSSLPIVYVPWQVAPLCRRKFFISLSDEQKLHIWTAKQIAIVFMNNQISLDIGYVCERQADGFIPISRITITKTGQEIYNWSDSVIPIEAEEALDQICSGLDFQAASLEEQLERVDAEADNMLRGIARLTYLESDTQTGIYLVANALNTTNASITNVPEHLISYLQHDMQKLVAIDTPADEKRYLQSYMQTVSLIPWENIQTLHVLANARQELDKTHYGMHSTKEQLLDLLAIYQQKGKLPMSPLLVGPPGVGKTSLVRALAALTALSCQVIPLAGLEDPSTLLGFTKTYKDAQPGRIIKALISSKTMNPLLILDELDKCSYRIQNTLLHILDPDHRDLFVDNYLGFPVDLGNVLFVTTANNVDNLIEPLRRRLHIIETPAYSQIERLQLIRDYVWPKLQRTYSANHLQLLDEDLERLSKLQSTGQAESQLYRALGTCLRKNRRVLQFEPLSTETPKQVGFV